MDAQIYGQLRACLEREKRYKQKIAEQAKRIRTLQAAVFALVGDNEEIIESDPEDVSVRLEELSIAQDDPYPSQVDREDDLEYSNSNDEQASESVELQDPLWDSADNVYRCNECMYELESDVCFRCGKAFSIDLERLDTDNITRSVVTDHASLNPDRRLAPRGDTPLRDFPKYNILPKAYSNRGEEYDALLGRGATRAMCEQYELEFSDKRGIVAWADDGLFDAFSGPGMQEGDRWKIYLGRRIQLEQSDRDGSEFIESLLEEVLLYPLHTRKEPHRSERWITVREAPGVWATRPAVAAESDAHKTTRRVDPHASEFVDEDEYDTDMAEDDAAWPSESEYEEDEEERDFRAEYSLAEEHEELPTIRYDVYEIDEEEEDELQEEEEAEEEEESTPIHYALSTDAFDGTYDPEEDEDFSSDETSSDYDQLEEIVSGDEDVIQGYS